MKPFPRKILSLFLAAALTLTLSIPAAASEALGDDLTSTDTLLSQQTELSTNVFWSTSSSDFRTENLITYSPNSHVTPIVTYGDVLTSRSTISNAAKNLEAQGYRVVAGINGDFYSLSSGLPVGIVVTNGQLRTTDDGVYAIGFHPDGSAVLGRPSLKITANLGYGDDPFRQLKAVNKFRNADGIYLFTYDFNAAHTTGNSQPGVDVVCRIQDGSLSIGGTQTLIVEQVIEAETATAIAPGQVVLSVNNRCDAYFTDVLRNIPVGTLVTVDVSANGGSVWNDVQYAMGALYSLVENGSVAPGLEAGTHPRTAVGQKADGTLVFYTIDGRRPGHSIGASMTQLAKRLIELGCVTAVCLDGGGSTTLTVTAPGSVNAKTVNRPSEGSERAVTNQLFLVASPTPSGMLDHFHLTAEHPYILAGSKTPVYTDAIDTNYIPMSADYTLTSSAGTMEANVLTTPLEGGDIVVTASNGAQSGSTTVHAVTTPDAVSIRDQKNNIIQSLNVQTGSVTKLNPVASYLYKYLHADPEAFIWSVNGGIGTIDQQGNFTAIMTGTGTITLTGGSRSATVNVTVTGDVPATEPSTVPGEDPGTLPETPSGTAFQTVEDFEGETTIFRGSGKGIDYSLSHAANTVRMGRGSAKLDYTLLQAENYSASWYAGHPAEAIGAPYDALNLWVYGDGSGNTLSLLYSDGVSENLEQPVTALDFVGWKQVSVSLPGQTFSLQGLRVSGTKAVRTGVVYIDHITAALQGAVDNAAPVITLSPAGNNLDALVYDGTDGYLPQSGISVAWDGSEHAFTYDQTSGHLTISLSTDGKPHRVTITAKDASGNIGRSSYDVPTGENWTPSFRDTQDYWAAAYVDYLYTAGITTGYEDNTFRPDEEISRQQFAVMLYRCLGLDGRQYEQTSLPFADRKSISSYATTAIKALYTEGILTGSKSSDGKLYFHPGDSLTRAQAAAMIGRTQAKGYAAATLSFTDSEEIPNYALFYIQTMTAQGIIGGYADGTFRPSNNITRGQMAKILYNLM